MRRIIAVLVAVVAVGIVPGAATAKQDASARAHAAAVSVPSVKCRRLDIAEDILRSRGLRYREVGGGVFGIVVKANWKVVGQSPGPGSRVKRGKRVTLYVGRSC